MKNRQIAVVVGAAALATLFGACAQQVGDIDRTQPNRIAKDELIQDGAEWYYHQTVINTNATAFQSSTGSYGGLERIRFEITENNLIGFRTHADVVGIETSNIGLPSDAQNFDGGAAVVSFPIDSHFDVIRQYNASTGEGGNVIVENSNDRHWNEREFMRVDWSSSQIYTTWDEIGDVDAAAAVTLAPQDQTENPTWFVERDVDDNINYIDIVQTYIIQDVDWYTCLERYGWGVLYAGFCGAETVEVRTSLLRVDEDPEDDYLPREFDDRDMTQFGFFRTERCTYDGRFGCTESGTVRVANIWDIWNRDENGVRTEWEPIVYYVSPEFPLDLLDETWEIAHQYDVAFQTVVNGRLDHDFEGNDDHMFYICLNPGFADDSWRDSAYYAEAQEFAYNDEDLAFLERAFEESERGYATGACHNGGEIKNYGDLRYNMVNWINNEPNARWLGLGPTFADPITGQSINAYANVGGAGLNTYTQWALNIVNVINGHYDPEELGLGEPMQDYFDGLRAEGTNAYFDFDKSEGEWSPAMHDIDRRMRHNEQVRQIAQSTMATERFQLLAANGIENLRPRNAEQQDPMARLRDTPIERQMMVPEVVEAMTPLVNQTGMGVEDERLLEMMSPVRIGTANALYEASERENNRLRGLNMMLASDFDGMLLGLARELAEQETHWIEVENMSPARAQERLFFELRARIYRAVTEHELGHTMGLRHNFAGSADAMNYFPQYWALRQASFNPDCNDTDGYSTFDVSGMTTGALAPVDCAGESQEDYLARAATTERQILDGTAGGFDYQGIYEYAYSSIMDYGARVNTDFAGLGLYDYAALNYAYGDMVEVFNNPPHMLEIDYEYDEDAALMNGGIAIGDRMVTDMSDVDYVVTHMPEPPNYPATEPVWPDTIEDETGDGVKDNAWDHYHYSVLPMMFGGISSYVEGESPEYLDEQYFDFRGIDAMYGLYDRSYHPIETVEAEGMLRVPYKFCSDEYRGGTPYCQIFDGGADEQEIFETRRVFYENYYVIDYFNRDRPFFNQYMASSVLRRTLSRAFEPMIDIYQHWIIRLNFPDAGIEWYGFDFGGNTGFAASIDAINQVAGALTTPTIGTYAYNPETDAYENLTTSLNFEFDPIDRENFTLYGSQDHLNMTFADGARYGQDMYRSPEESYYFTRQLDVLSSFWTKWAAMIAITDGSVFIIDPNADSSSQNFWVDAYMVFDTALTNLFGGIITEDLRDIGGCVLPDGTIEVPGAIEDNDVSFSCDALGGRVLNPYTETYGHSDRTMRIFATVYGHSYFQSVLDMGFLDNAAVYIAGRGETPELPEVCDNGIDDDGDGSADCNDTDCMDMAYCEDVATSDCFTDGVTNGTCGRICELRNGVLDTENGLSTTCQQLLSYTDPDGITYVAICPMGWDATNNLDDVVHIGCDLVQNAIDMQVNVDLGDEDAFELANVIETMRFVVQTNRAYNDWNSVDYDWLTHGNPF